MSMLIELVADPETLGLLLLAALGFVAWGRRPRRRGLEALFAHPARAGWRFDRLNPRNWRRPPTDGGQA